MSGDAYTVVLLLLLILVLYIGHSEPDVTNYHLTWHDRRPHIERKEGR